MKAYKIYIWKSAPFLRLLLPLVAGITLQHYFKFSPLPIVYAAILLTVVLMLFSMIPLAFRFKLMAVQGILITLFMIVAGTYLTWRKDIRNNKMWYGNSYDTASLIIASIKEPPIKKAKSYKTIAEVNHLVKGDSLIPVKGDILVYFSNDSVVPGYGDQIILDKNLQAIKNSGNPGAFDYARYSSFHQLFHQLYLKGNQWVVAGKKRTSAYQSLMFRLREQIKEIIYKYVPGSREKSIALALLIGYKIDLDKDLVQAYSNAGIVHLIAISGLHMGIIYSILFWFVSRMPVLKKSKVARFAIILFCLWFFAFLTGASGTVLRAAFMFSFISVGLAINKRSSIYNSMAASAFILLCYNPFLLWDVGFQLSYLAVLGIVICQPHISKWFYFKNKLLQAMWQLSSVSLAAQVFTFPVCMYYFHQLPLLFLFSNLVAIPLSTIALWTCLLLVMLSQVTFLAYIAGKIVFYAIWLINKTVYVINALPFSLWDNISLNVFETVVLYVVVCCFLGWLAKKEKSFFYIGLAFSMAFVCMITMNKWEAYSQKKMVVYNVPAHRAIDFIAGDRYQFYGDTEMTDEGVLRNFHLKPSRIFLTARNEGDISKMLYKNEKFLKFHDRRILIVDTAIAYERPVERIPIDYLIISKNPKVFIPKLAEVFETDMYIFDASNPMWKIEKWKKDCEDLHLRFHSVPEQGAFISDL